MLKRFVVAAAVCVLIAGCGRSAGPSKEQVTQAVKRILPVSFEVVDIHELKEMPGLYEVALQSSGQPVVVYMDKNAKYLISGSLMALESKTNLTAESQKKYARK